MDFELLKYSAFIAVFAVTYRLILAYEPILNWWFMFGNKFEKRFFYRPIWGCEKCFAGQIAFWIYLFGWTSSYFNGNAPFWRFVFNLIPQYQKNDYNVLNGLIFVFVSVFLTKSLSKLYEKYLK